MKYHHIIKTNNTRKQREVFENHMRLEENYRKPTILVNKR